jgi:dUTP pyrophosphatase
MITTVKFAKTRPDVKIPTKRKEDAGFDIYACFDDDYIVIPPCRTVMIPTGLISMCDEDYCFVLKERGSMGSKGIALRAGIIDSGFRDAWNVFLTNTHNIHMVVISKLSEDDTRRKLYPNLSDIVRPTSDIIYPYDKAICQALVVPVPEVEVEEWTVDEIKAIKSERGEGMLGSSGK